MSRLYCLLPVLIVIAFTAVPATAGTGTEEVHKLIRVYEDGSGITREIVREPWDIASWRSGEWVDLVVDGTEFSAISGRAANIETLREDLNAAFDVFRATAEFGAYHTYAEIDSAFSALQALYPSLVQKLDIGDSVEGRDILAIKISDNVTVAEGEPQALIMGCHHAREVITPEMPFLFAEYLLDNYGTDSLVTALVNDREIWLVPLVNPDGHQYVVDGETFWRKNRRNNGDGNWGVDLNRNYTYQWAYDDVGSSPFTWSETYRGTAPASEPETQAIINLYETNAFSMSLSFHSYGRLYLYPWGYAPIQPEDIGVFTAAADSMSAGNGYVHGNTYTGILYSVNGETDDYAYGDTLKPKCFAFTPEVGDEFDTPEALIPGHFAEQLPAMLFVVKHAADPHRLDRPGAPTIASLPDDDDGDYLVSWTRGDGDTNITAYELTEATGEVFVLDSAEAGIDNWITDTWTWNDEKQHSGSYGFYSGTGDQYTATLESKYPVDVSAADSLVFWAWWRLELDWDYWYVEVSTDGGKFYTTIPGSYTTDYNPNGNNIGNGITGNSSGNFYRMAFDLGGFAGESATVRWRYSTDQLTNLRGVQIDDIENVRLFTNVDTLANGIAGESFPVTGRTTDRYFYQVRGMDQEGSWGYGSNVAGVNVDAISTEVLSGDAPLVTSLGRNAPNPFNPATTISFTLAERAPVELSIHDISGRLVKTLVRDIRDAGDHQATWDGTNDRGREVSSGIYLYRMNTAGMTDTKKLVLLR